MEPTANESTLGPDSKPKRKYKQRLSKSDAEKAIAQLEVTHRYVKRDILAALKSKECGPGTNSRLAYLKALQQLEIDYVEQITKMGVLPKNVASQTTTEYIFKAHVSRGGSVQTMPVNNKVLHEMEMKRSAHSSKPSTATVQCSLRRNRSPAEKPKVPTRSTAVKFPT
jgi:hypothetical protein